MKVCIITPMILPVPAVRGGAVENLITILLDQNEKYNDTTFDVYTVFDKNIKNTYKNTNIIQIKLSSVTVFFQRCINKILNIFKIDKYYDFSSLKYKKIIKYINKAKYDAIVFENNMLLYKQVVPKIKYTNVPLYFHLHNDLNKVDKTVDDYKYILNTSRKIFVVSNFLKNRLENIIKTDKVEVLFNVINKNEYLNYKYDINDIKSLKETFKIKENDIVVGYVGRPDFDKGLLELIKSFNMIDKDNIKLLAVTDDFTKYKYKKGYTNILFEEYEKNKENIKITGRVEYKDMPLYYKLIDILVIPTVCEEAFGMVALEAKTLNKRIIYTNSGALNEILENKNSIMINLDDNLILNLKETMIKEISKYKKVSNIKIKEKMKDNLKDYYENFIKIINNK